MKILKNQRGEGYVDVIVEVLVSMMLIVLALNTFTFLGIKQDMDYFAKEMVECAALNGQTYADTNNRYNELAEETGLRPSYTFKADYYNSAAGTVQLGDTITVNLTYKTTFKGFGVFGLPITLTANHSALSQRYWK